MMAKIKVLQKLCIKRVISTKLYCEMKKRRKKKNYRVGYTGLRFNFDSYSKSECLLYFRFTRGEMIQLLISLKIPRVNKLENGITFSGQEGLCVLLRRLSSTTRFCDLVEMFQRDEGTLSKINTFMINWIYENHAKRLYSLKQKYLTRDQLQELANNSYENGCPYQNVIGFIDGTCRPICRPTYNQRAMYSGYKREHVMKYQSVVLTNGLIGRLDGPFIGRRHDAAIVHLSRFLHEMESSFTYDDGTYWCVYGDVGYVNQKYIKVGFKGFSKLTPQQKEFNGNMSALRVSVEYGFGKMLQQFPHLDYKKKQKMYLSPLKKIYFVSAFLVNCQSCIRGTNQVSDIFKSYVPTLAEYLS